MISATSTSTSKQATQSEKYLVIQHEFLGKILPLSDGKKDKLRHSSRARNFKEG